MTFDAQYFDRPTRRRDTGSYKWDSVAADVTPLWVADMDFPTAPCIVEALRRRVDTGIFGYTKVRRQFYDAAIDWFTRRHGWTFSADQVIYTSGVVPAISAILKAVTRPGDRVIVQTPAFNCFFSSIRNNGCLLAANPLIITPDGYDMDLADLEGLAADPRTTAMILCNPHNPGGAVWPPERLAQVDAICRRHNVFVISDEIHCELTFSGVEYTPYGRLGLDALGNCAVCFSPSKAFNIAGLQIADIVVTDPEMRRRIDRAINDNEVCDVNPFGVDAQIAAYTDGREWLDGLRAYLEGNYRLVCDELRPLAPAVQVRPMQATYLAWLDCRGLRMNSEQLDRLLVEQAHVHLSPGDDFGPGGDGFMRLNFATQRAPLHRALTAIRTALEPLAAK